MRSLHLVTYDYRFDMVNECRRISRNYWELPADYTHSPSFVRPLASESWWIVPGTLDPRID